jgi:hypothetical protein
MDAGLAWSTNRSWRGSIGPRRPDFETHTLFTSATLQARLTSPDSRWGLTAGAGPALIYHGGSGSSLLTRQTDLGAVLTVSGSRSLDGRFSFRLDAQQYLFSSCFADAYTGPFIGSPIQPAGSHFRSEFVLLAGFAWQPS